MTVTEQGCAELAERLEDWSKSLSQSYEIAARRPDREGSTPRAASLRDRATDLNQAATILSRLTVEELAGVIGEAHDGWAKDNSPLARPAYIASALLDHITAETEVKV